MSARSGSHGCTDQRRQGLLQSENQSDDSAPIPFLARAVKRNQTYESAEEVFRAADAGELDIDPRKNPSLYLPPSLLRQAVGRARDLSGSWVLEKDGFGRSSLRYTRPDGTRFEGYYEPAGKDEPPSVRVTITRGS